MLAKVSQDITAELRHQEALAAANRQLQLLATTDSLTGLARRGVFELQAENEFALFKRNHLPLSILLLDIDNFKYRNDTFGHAAGDEALKVLAGVLRACVRAGDLVARIGGEEFAFLLPQTTSAGAMSLAKRIQETLRAAEHGPLPLTVSIGIATSEEGTPAWRHVLARADEAMYEVKQTGKNRAITYDSLSL